MIPQDEIEASEGGLLAVICCASCDAEFDDEERESPRRDSNGDALCDACYREEYEGTCDRCDEIVEKTELAMKPGELLAFWEEVDGLKPGYYKVIRWPLYADGMINGYVYTENLQFFAALDAKGVAAAKDAWTPGGCLCAACRSEILQHNAEL
jgi:hypothetical protein